jgi:hypothetical protein
MKKVYIVLDDSPLVGTAQALDCIKSAAIKASAMPIGVHSTYGKNKELLDREIKELGAPNVGNHSYCYANNHYAEFYRDPQAVYADFQQAEKVMGITSKLCSLPGRNHWIVGGRSRFDAATSSGESSAKLLSEKGYTVIGWDYDWQYDHKSHLPIDSVCRAAEVIDSVIERVAFTKGHAVVLVHDQMFSNSKAAAEFMTLVRVLRENGYEFCALSEYPTC